MNGPGDRCWRSIGVWGDGSCAKLPEAGHCRHCPTYAAAGRRLFERPVPEGYAEEWTGLLAAVKEPPPVGAVALLVFRVWREWLALPATLFQEARAMGPVRTIPLRSNEVLRGLVCVHGELLPCVSLGHLLRLDESGVEGAGGPWMLVVGEGGGRFVFPASEIRGLRHVPECDLQAPPATVTKFAAAMVERVFTEGEKTVGVLARDRFMEALGRSLST